MPRIRTIKPDFFTNEEIGRLPAEARLLFIGLWILADREGRLQDRPIRIRAQLFPYDTWAVASLLEDLEEANLIWRYEAEGKKCIQIINFAKHQSPHPKETKYGLPPAPQSQGREVSGNSTESRETQPPSPVDCGLMDYGLMEHGAPTVLVAQDRATASPDKPATASRRNVCSDKLLTELQAKPAYQALDVRHVYAKMAVWCEAKGKQPTRMRLLNWLNREDRPITGPAGKGEELTELIEKRLALKRDNLSKTTGGS
jgi:hypothetical protein